jgi:DNA-binding IclR family transcriptional regulator
MSVRDPPLSQISAPSVSRIEPRPLFDMPHVACRTACGVQNYAEWAAPQLLQRARAGRRLPWEVNRNLLWVRTSSCLAAAICTTESTSVIARSLTTPASRMVCAEDRWKKFLSLVS